MVLVDTEGRPVSGEGPQGGADAVAVELRDASGAVTRHAPVPYPTPALRTVYCLHQSCWGVVGLRGLAETCGAVTRHAPVLARSLCLRALRACSRKQVLHLASSARVRPCAFLLSSGPARLCRRIVALQSFVRPDQAHMHPSRSLAQRVLRQAAGAQRAGRLLLHLPAQQVARAPAAPGRCRSHGRARLK